MRSSFFAEWIITRVVGQNRAAAIIGDLLEDSCGKGLVWFWLSVAGIVLSQTWRRALGFVIGFCCGFYFLGLLQMPIAGRLGIHGSHWHAHGWVPLFTVVRDAAILLSFAVPYVGIRYGHKDPFVRRVFAVWALSIILTLYWWIPAVAVMSVVFSTGFFFYSLQSSRGRRTLAAVIAALALSFAGAMPILYIGGLLSQNFIVTNLDQTHWRLFEFLLSVVSSFGVLTQTFIYSRVHQIFLRANDGAKGTF